MPLTFAQLNTSLGKPKPITIQVLLDSGGSRTVIWSSLATKLRKKKITPTSWSTMAGNVTTAKLAKIQFSLPKFFDDRLVEWDVHLTQNLGNYDMIIGISLDKVQDQSR